jgi:hypothetical protein
MVMRDRRKRTAAGIMAALVYRQAARGVGFRAD